jgi:hypothetical protein
LPDLDGTPRYFWYDRVMPMSTAVGQLIRYDLHDAVGDENTIIYHYTTPAAFLAIMETRSLWLTDFAYLNDASEVSHGLELARCAFAELVTKDDLAAPLLNAVFARVSTEIPRTAVTCFSLVSDSLSQWRAYSRGSCGVALGFRPIDLMQSLGNESSVRFSKVLYLPEAKQTLFRRFVHYHRLAWEHDAQNTEPRWINACISLATIGLFELAALCKDEGFADEREYRMIYQRDADNPETLPKRFRVDGSLFVPYVSTEDIQNMAEATDENRSQFCPVEVVVGPHPLNDVIARGIREYLDTNNLVTVRTVRTGIPFR